MKKILLFIMLISATSSIIMNSAAAPNAEQIEKERLQRISDEKLLVLLATGDIKKLPGAEITPEGRAAIMAIMKRKGGDDGDETKLKD